MLKTILKNEMYMYSENMFVCKQVGKFVEECPSLRGDWGKGRRDNGSGQGRI